ncbi:hypothetical protein [Klebsiella michiganensis]|uniref:hypothetical protein n=1 Tax=Klebsiella michiganensis TaxID=1134687 RepID=UPI000EFAB79B|nr:hypothetical protein [Klebsiella michiganensis]RMC92451.1 hypothetical protein EBH72_11800 [Klebsiella michiganensis]
MKGYSLSDMLEKIISDNEIKTFVYDAGKDAYYIHEELDGMKRALHLATREILERMDTCSDSPSLNEKISAVSEINNLRGILDYFDNEISRQERELRTKNGI